MFKPWDRCNLVSLHLGNSIRAVHDEIRGLLQVFVVQVLREPKTQDLLQHFHPLLSSRRLKNADCILCNFNGWTNWSGARIII